MHQLWKHPNGTYYALHGARLRKRASLRTKDRAEAEVRHAQFVAASGGLAPDAPSVGTILDGYKDSRSSEIRSPNALKFAVQALKPKLGDLLPDHLLPTTIKRYARDRAAEGVGAGTILREIGVLRAALKWAFRSKWLAIVPSIQNPVKAPKGRERWLSRDEAKRLLAACQVAHLRLFVMLGLMTGARSGAIFELKWDQVDLTRRLIDYGEGHGNKRRVIAPINEELLKALHAAQELACTDFVIEHHGKPVGTVKNGFAAACERARVKGVTPHILRHTCATWLVEAGLEDEAARLLGDTVDMIRRVYGHHSPEYLKRATAALQFTQAAE